MPAAYKDFSDNVVLTAAEMDALQQWVIDQFLAKDIGADRGMVIYRGASGWTVLSPGTAGQLLKTAGAGADVAWAWMGAVQIGSAAGASSDPATSSTSYVDMTDMSVTLTTKGGDLLVLLQSDYSNNTTPSTNSFALALDGAAEVAETTMQTLSSGAPQNAFTFHRFTGVSAASHTIKGRNKVSAGTLTLSGTRRRMLVLEVVTP